LGGEHHARQNQNCRHDVTNWSASWRMVIAMADGMVIDNGGGPLQLRQPCRYTGA
jgi:hypothetical protein